MATRESAVYLQGLTVEGPMLLGSPWNVVHLDSVRFQARLPDRDRLIEQEAQLKQVDAALAALWRDRLLAAKRVATPEVFVGRCFKAAWLFGHIGLFNDVPVLPEGLLQRIVGYPRHEAYDDAGYLTPFRRAPTRAEGKAVVCGSHAWAPSARTPSRAGCTHASGPISSWRRRL